MGMSNYTDFANGVTIRGVPLQMTNPGKVFWVNNSGVLPEGGIGASSGNPGTYLQPFNTIDTAIGKCTAGRGDIIIVMPGHSETITTDGGIAADVAGVVIIGLGMGTLKPKVVFDAEAAAVVVSAANTTFMNIVFEASFADITNAIDVTAAYLSLINCEWKEEGANLNFLDIIAATGAANTADGLYIENGISTAIDAGINSMLNITDDIDRLTVLDCLAVHDHANALAMVLQATGKKMTNIKVLRNHYASLKTSGDVLIDNDVATNSGIVADNFASHLIAAAEVLIDCDGVGMFNNYGSGVITASGYLLPAADS